MTHVLSYTNKFIPSTAKESPCGLCDDLWKHGFNLPCPKLQEFNETTKMRVGEAKCREEEAI